MKTIVVQMARTEARSDEALAEVFTAAPGHPLFLAVQECIDAGIVDANNTALQHDNTVKQTDMALGGVERLLMLKDRLNGLVQLGKEMGEKEKKKADRQ